MPRCWFFRSAADLPALIQTVEMLSSTEHAAVSATDALDQERDSWDLVADEYLRLIDSKED